MTSDVDAARTFYAELFGWTAEAPSEEFGGDFMFLKDGVPMAGGMPAMPDAGAANVWSVYLATDDVNRVVELATANGAQIYAPPMAVADLGSMAVMSDSTGAAIGTWQPATFHGFALLGEPNTPSWFELHTRDFDGALAFYKTVFGWDTRPTPDSPGVPYAVALDGETAVAGVIDATGFLPEGMPNYWTVYFGVEDADAAVARVVELGGSVVTPAEDTPYGRLATVADPCGAMFKLVATSTATSG